MERLSGTSQSGIRLGSLRIANTTEVAHTVDILIERGSKSVYHETSEIAGNDGVWIEPTWSSEPADYDLYYVISGFNELQMAKLNELHEDEMEGDCLFADLWITEEVADSFVTAKDTAEEEIATCNF